MLLRHRPPEADGVRLLDQPGRIGLERRALGRRVVRLVGFGEVVVPDDPQEAVIRRPRAEHLESLGDAQRQHSLVPLAAEVLQRTLFDAVGVQLPLHQASSPSVATTASAITFNGRCDA